jgi:mono/diheme cytochrome c family protein
MTKPDSFLLSSLAIAAICFCSCSENKSAVEPATPEVPDYGGYETQVAWGEHLVTIGGCHDCHTPKLMTPQGPADDSSRMLSGHPADMPPPDVDRKQMESKGLVVTATFTAWVGPWGITYSANLTPHETGTGNWTEDQFIYAIKNNVSKGLPGARPLLPPMAMMLVKLMTEDELKAIFAYLRTIKPIENASVQPTPPALAAQ